MEDQVMAELEIIRSELQKVGLNVPVRSIAKWSVSDRARVEQWAIHKRWASLKKPPCPPDHTFQTNPVRPHVLDWWVKN